MTDILAQIETITMNLRVTLPPVFPGAIPGLLRARTWMEENTELNNTMALEKRMLSIRDLSDYLGVSPQSIYNRLSAGTFPIKTKRIGRRLKWDRRDVDHYLDRLPTIN
jgi:predicted DNA-binding transcriptional regulator AlpA